MAASPARTPAGATLVAHASAHAYSAAAVIGLPYDPLRDFIAIAALTSPALCGGHGPATRIMTLGQLIATARARPGELTFATTGIGSGTHLGIEELNLAAGINAKDVPASSDEAITDVSESVTCGRYIHMQRHRCEDRLSPGGYYSFLVVADQLEAESRLH